MLTWLPVVKCSWVRQNSDLVAEGDVVAAVGQIAARRGCLAVNYSR